MSDHPHNRATMPQDVRGWCNEGSVLLGMGHLLYYRAGAEGTSTK